MVPRLVVFDLDGTLIDSGADLCASVNAMLHHFGRPPLPQPVISTYIGDGAARLVSRSLGEPVDAAFHDSALTYFLDYYREHKLDHTYVYPGVFASLDSLRFEPAGALYLFPRLDPDVYKITDDERMVIDLLEQQHLLLSHGTGFNLPTADHLRIVFLADVDLLADAVGRLATFLSDYQQ